MDCNLGNPELNKEQGKFLAMAIVIVQTSTQLHIQTVTFDSTRQIEHTFLFTQALKHSNGNMLYRTNNQTITNSGTTLGNLLIDLRQTTNKPQMRENGKQTQTLNNVSDLQHCKPQLLTD